MTKDRPSCAAASRSTARPRLKGLRCRGTLAIAALAAGLALIVPASAALIVTESKLTPPGGGEAGALFGQAVAIDGDTAVVGAPNDDTDAGVDAGSASVYVRGDDGNWSLQQGLTAGDGAASGLFGWSVSVDGDTLIVGARGDTHGTRTAAGSAYVFVRVGTTWTLQQKLVATDGRAFDGLGFSVAVEGDLALVGAWGRNTEDGPDAGAVYPFSRSGTVWTEGKKLKASDGETGAVFGSAVALSGQTGVVGAYGDDGPAGTDQGAAYAFVYDGTEWDQQQKLTPAAAQAGALAGFSVDVAGDLAVIGSPSHDAGLDADAGQANVFLRSGTVWSEQQTLGADDADAGDGFGAAVGLDGSTIVVGAQVDDTEAGVDAGSAYVFTQGSPWTQVAHLRASDGESGDSLGGSAAFSVDTALAGASGDDSPAGANAGSAYAFTLKEAAGCSRSGPTLTIELAPGATTIGRSGTSITVNGAPCADATVNNVDTVNVTGTIDTELLQLDLTGGQFAPGLTPEGSGASEIEFAINLGAGNDRLTVQYGAVADSSRLGAAGINLNVDDDTDVTLVAVEGVTVNGGNGDDTISGAGGAGTGGLFPLPLVLNGDGGRDKLTGGAVNDVQNGGDGNDTLSANKNADGADVLNGDAGRDSTSYSARGDVVVTLDGLANDGGSGGGEGDNVQTEGVTGGKGNDTLDGGPTASGNTLDGGNGNDTVLGRDGNDTLQGGNGADNIQGGNGNDRLKAMDGVSGNDSADGGAGTDTCTADIGDTVLNCEA